MPLTRIRETTRSGYFDPTCEAGTYCSRRRSSSSEEDARINPTSVLASNCAGPKLRKSEMRISRRNFIGATATGLIATPLMLSARAETTRSRAPLPPALTNAQISTMSDAQLLDDIEHRTFNFFWEKVNHANGLMVDRWPTRSFASIAATGFALAAWPVGVERGWITRASGPRYHAVYPPLP